MKLDCDKHLVWHRWFAWYPVRLAEHDCRWLEWVERHLTGVYVSSSWVFREFEYRPVGGTQEKSPN